MVGTARQFSNRWSARALRALPQGQPLLGGHQQQRARVALQPAGGHSARALHRGPDASSSRRSAAARPTSSPSSTAPTRSTTRRRSSRSGASDKAFVRGSYTWSHYYGNFDQDNSTTANDANVFIGSSFIGDGAGPPALGLQGRRPARRPPAHVQALRLLHAEVERDGRRLRVRAVGPAVGDVELRAVYRADHQHHRHVPVRRAGGVAPHQSARAARSNYTQNFRLGGRAQLQVDADLFNVFNNQTGYNPQPAFHTGACSACRGTSTIRGASRSRRDSGSRSVGAVDADVHSSL